MNILTCAFALDLTYATFSLYYYLEATGFDFSDDKTTAFRHELADAWHSKFGNLSQWLLDMFHSLGSNIPLLDRDDAITIRDSMKQVDMEQIGDAFIFKAAEALVLSAAETRRQMNNVATDLILYCHYCAASDDIIGRFDQHMQ